MVKNPFVSIIIVNYKVKEDLFKCINSIYVSKPKTKFEIIVVDNDEIKTIKKSLLVKFPDVNYIASIKNLGFGGGNNLGAKYAKGKYLFFLNPDTEIINKTIDGLCNSIAKTKNTGIVAPLLLDKNKQEYLLQGTKELTPLKAILNLSFASKIFSKLKINQKYYIHEWDKNGLRKVDVCPGTAFIISKELFRRVRGFDENFFLYFEEFDLCKRIREIGLDIYINPNVKLIHKWGASTAQFKNKERVFKDSRFHYFKKHFGFIEALLTESVLTINKFNFFIVLVVIFSFILRVYNLAQSMVFIGDQGWFYLSARDLLLNGNIPLVGITSSHTWLHQGPLWTYMLAVFLSIFKFNPLSGAYLTALFGSATVLLTYRFGSEMFSKRIGAIAALLYAVSPLIVFFDRMPFDPSPIPFFALLYLYCLFKWVNGNVKYFPCILFLIAILYNLELATFTVFIVFVTLFLYGYFKKAHWFKKILNKTTITISAVAVLVPMTPVIIYDFSHGFKQTIVFLAWIVYKPFSLLINHSSGNFIHNFGIILNFLLTNLQGMIFKFNLQLAESIFGLGVMYLIFTIIKKLEIRSANLILIFLLLISLLGVLINQTPSDAYLPIVFPFVILAIAIFFDYLLSVKLLSYVAFVALCLVVITNCYFSYLSTQGNEFQLQNKAAEAVIKLTKGQKYNLIGRGPGSQFASFTMNYEYLLWYKGFPPSKTSTSQIISIAELNGKIIISRQKN